jgi:aspartyl-tRNA synthetase
MYKAFEILGYNHDFVEQKFGAMLEAFKFGAPPHAGCAFGLERIFMVLIGEDNIREVVAFPKSAAGVDLMMASPSEADSKQLDELKLQLDIDFD